MAKKNHNSGNMGKVLGTLGIAAAAFGAYMLYGSKEGAKRREKIKSWALKMKGDVLEKIEDAKEVTEEKYNQIVDEVALKYRAAKNIDMGELASVVDELRGHWEAIKKQFQDAEKKVKKSSK